MRFVRTSIENEKQRMKRKKKEEKSYIELKSNFVGVNTKN